MEDDDYTSVKIKRCKRNVPINKHERNDPEARNWWAQLFKELEDDAQIPPSQRIEVINEMYPPELVTKIASILTFIGDAPKLEKKIQEHEVDIDTSDSSAGYVYPGSVSTVSSERDSLEHAYIIPEKASRGKLAGPNNPYLKFFKRRPDRTAIWRELPPLSLDEMNLTQKADAITEMIATDFVDWLIKLGGDEEPTLDVPTVMKMFEIGFNMHAATSLCVRIKEMPSVPGSVAEARNLPEMNARVKLHRHIQHDIQDSMKKKKMCAFGSELPVELRCRPIKENIADKWLHCKRVPKHLQSMEAVWDGITHLRSTRAYCSHLIDHPEIPAPEYLNQVGMLNPDFLKAKHYSIETQDSLSPITVPAGLAEQAAKSTEDD